MNKQSRELRFVLFFAGLSVAWMSVQSRSFEVVPLATNGFEELQPGQPLAEIGWTGNAESFVGTDGWSGSGVMSIQIFEEERKMAWSPRQDPEFNDEALVFSAGICVDPSDISGARISLASHTAGGSSPDGKLGGFGVMDTPTTVEGEKKKHRITFYDPTQGGWIYSALTVRPNTWYEFLLVVNLERENPGKSSASLYFRTPEDLDYQEVPEFQNHSMSWYTSDHNASHFAYWRIENARTNVRLDNFTAGSIKP